MSSRPRTATWYGVRRLYHWTTTFGLDPRRTARAVRGFPHLIRDYLALRSAVQRDAAAMPLEFALPCPHDRYESSGVARGHYFHQDLHVAQRVFAAAPRLHVDVGSRVDGFVAHVAAFRPVEVLDIRPLDAEVHNITFRVCDVTAPGREFEGYCDSLSCLHALEHFGLGRYGDVIDLSGHERGFESMARMLVPGGTFYLSVPIGPERIEFNAHRVFAVGTVLRMAEQEFELTAFSYVDDAGDLHRHVPLTEEAIVTSCGVWFGCGIFEFRKRG